MKNAEIARQLSAIRALIKNSSAASAADLELQAHWARYACVLSAGLMENAVIILYSNFISLNAKKPVANYSIVQIAKVQNPKTKRFIEIARAFKNAWADDLEKFVEQDGRKEAIDA